MKSIKYNMVNNNVGHHKLVDHLFKKYIICKTFLSVKSNLKTSHALAFRHDLQVS
jgi:hypothetical protein